MSAKNHHSKPPQLALKLLSHIYDSSIMEEINGDLDELYQIRLEERGKFHADWHYYKDVFLSIRNYSLRRKKSQYSKSHTIMFKNYWKTSLRNLLKNKIYSVLNISGLALGIVACFYIFQYVRYERSYDQFHSQVDNIFRVKYQIFKNGEQIIDCAAAVPRVGPFMKEKMPEVIEYARAFPMSGIVAHDDIFFRESRMHIADPSFLKIFDFPLLRGDIKTALNEPFTGVVSESLAKKFFGNIDVIGKRLKINGDDEFEITGVAQDVPENSHIKFDVLVSYATLNKMTDNESEESWGWYDFNTYVLLKDNTDIEEFDQKFDELLVEERGEAFEKNNNRVRFPLQSVSDIHLYSNLLQESEPAEQGDGKAVVLLTVIALFILIIAWINYINLSTARSLERAKEVGVRKVIGAQKNQLVFQFITESMLVNLIAFILAAALSFLFQPYFEQLSGITLNQELLFESNLWQLAVLVFIIGSVLAGLYPAFVLSSFNPVSVLKSKGKRGGIQVTMRKILVVFQFVTSMALIIGTIVVFQQMRYMQTMDLGFNLHQTLVVNGPAVFEFDSLRSDRIQSYKTEIKRSSNIEAVTSGSSVPGKEIFWTRGIRRAEDESGGGKVIYIASIDYEYFPAMDIEIMAGRNFESSFTTDTANVILNHKALAFVGFNSAEEAINRKVSLGGQERTVVGVVNDYHQMSPKTTVSPMVFVMNQSSSGYFTYRVNPDNYQDALSEVERTYKEFFPGNPFEYYFLEEYFNEQYTTDNQFSKVFMIFTFLAIVVACLGLFGLSSLNTLYRSREIGIRKSMGASMQNIIMLLTRDIMLLVLIANLIAWPLIYFIMNNWLENFANRIQLQIWYFVLGGLLVYVIAFFTVFFNTYKTAKINPVKVLRG